MAEIKTLKEIENITDEEIIEVIKRWTTIGFTDHLDEIQLYNVSLAMEAAAIIIIESNKSNKYDKISTVAFPIARRIFQDVPTKIGPNTIVTNVIEMLKKLDDEYKPEDFESVDRTKEDPEAYFCADFSENYNLKL